MTAFIDLDSFKILIWVSSNKKLLKKAVAHKTALRYFQQPLITLLKWVGKRKTIMIAKNTKTFYRALWNVYR